MTIFYPDGDEWIMKSDDFPKLLMFLPLVDVRYEDDPKSMKSLERPLPHMTLSLPLTSGSILMFCIMLVPIMGQSPCSTITHSRQYLQIPVTLY
jgi:hypothetical protein